MIKVPLFCAYMYLYIGAGNTRAKVTKAKKNNLYPKHREQAILSLDIFVSESNEFYLYPSDKC